MASANFGRMDDQVYARAAAVSFARHAHRLPLVPAHRGLQNGLTGGEKGTGQGRVHRPSPVLRESLVPEQTGKSIFQVASRLTQFVFGLLHPLLRLTLLLTQLLTKGLDLQHQGILGVYQT